ncbi:clathrin heavy chain 1-like [Protopterus annectens]|uniref:clathrin heavy chain 1-like n=1 Tax=Protopterus annectens TaxID=7888 RepID=UPI001CFBE51B|nr:clathrin heavy chain 1-like [Protopterus annectens]XP_043942508.1 clathrin heavy chain 1-like [Protopterus annectens]XP_043942509.1 clathrin heavy chain 1-like [Protopterus annectens]XP_043942510.1 clathrin heavy chain 1-like [Protopterus annectens]
MSNSSPLVRITQLMQLQELGIKSSQITFPRVTLSSATSLCVRHDDPQNPAKSRATIINPYNPDSSSSWPINDADSVLVNPSRPLLVLRAGSVTQIYDVEKKNLYRQYDFWQRITFWIWLDSDTLAVITSGDVYHWNIKELEPQWMFSPCSEMWSTEIVGYHQDHNKQWLAISGLRLSQSGHVTGQSQLYSMEGRLGQVIEAQAVALPQYTFSLNKHPSSVFVAAVRGSQKKSGQLHVIELGPHKPGNASLITSRGNLPFQTGSQDFPSAIQYMPKLGLLFILSKYGFLFLSDLGSAQLIYTVQITTNIIFATISDTKTEGIVGVCKNGKVLSLSVCKHTLYQFLQRHTVSPCIVHRLLPILGYTKYKVTSV